MEKNGITSMLLILVNILKATGQIVSTIHINISMKICYQIVILFRTRTTFRTNFQITSAFIQITITVCHFPISQRSETINTNCVIVVICFDYQAKGIMALSEATILYIAPYQSAYRPNIHGKWYHDR